MNERKLKTKFFSKKSIGAVIGISLIMIIVIISIISFQTFYNQFSSNIESKIEKKSNINNLNLLEIEKGSSKTFLYIKNNNNNYIKINKVKINDKNCNLIDSNVVDKNSIQKIGVDCILNPQKIAEVVVITNLGIISKTKLIR